MMERDILEQCIQFVDNLENRESEVELAEKMGVELDDDNISLLAIQKLGHAITLLIDENPPTNQTKLLYYIALYANTIGKPRKGISLCYIVINHPQTSKKYQDIAKDLLTEIRLKLPKDMYTEELEQTTLDIHLALEDSQQWLSDYERHATQPQTKHVFNVDLLKQQFRNQTGK